MNRVVLIGRIAREFEVRKTQSGKSVTNITLAVDRRSDGADFIDVVIFDKQAENLARYINKGDEIAVSGWISTSIYDKDGQKRKRVEVVAVEVQWLRGKAEHTKEDFIEVNDALPWDDAT